MKKINSLMRISIFLLTGGLTFAQYANGILIGNEGNFGSPNADVSYWDSETMQVTNEVYETVNNENLGDVLQNIGIYGDKAYLVLNNSNKIVVVDRETFVKETVVTEHISLPRYITFANDKYYVTSSGDFNVSIFNIEDNTYLSEVVVDTQVEEIEAIGNHVFVQNGWYGVGNNIVVLDATTDQSVANIGVEEGINGIVTDGEYLYSVSSSNEYTHVYKIDGESLEIVAESRFTDVVGGKKITVSDDIVFFVANGNQVYGLPDSLEGTPTLLLTESENSWDTFYGFNVIGDYIFSGDANAFTEQSTVRVFDIETGDLTMDFTTGMGTNAFYLNMGNMAVSNISHQELQVKIYPNPVIDFVQLDGLQKANILVYDVNGKLVKNIDYNGSALNVSDLKSGLYFFVIQTEKGKITKKVLVK